MVEAPSFCELGVLHGLQNVNKEMKCLLGKAEGTFRPSSLVLQDTSTLLCKQMGGTAGMDRVPGHPVLALHTV